MGPRTPPPQRGGPGAGSGGRGGVLSGRGRAPLLCVARGLEGIQEAALDDFTGKDAQRQAREGGNATKLLKRPRLRRCLRFRAEGRPRSSAGRRGCQQRGRAAASPAATPKPSTPRSRPRRAAQLPAAPPSGDALQAQGGGRRGGLRPAGSTAR